MIFLMMCSQIASSWLRLTVFKVRNVNVNDCVSAWVCVVSVCGYECVSVCVVSVCEYECVWCQCVGMSVCGVNVWV